MPTKDNKDFDDVNGGFEFEPVPTWDDVEEGKPVAAEKTEFETDFSNLEFGGSADADNESDNGFGFNFDAMPTEQSVTAEQHRGDPSSEFEEFGISQEEYHSQGSHDVGFGASDDDVSHPSSAVEATQFDEFDQAFSIGADDHGHQSGADNSYYDDATEALTNGQYLGAVDDDPYTQVQDQQSMQQSAQASPASGQKSLLSKLILPVGIGAIVLVGGFVGYTSLMSSTAPAPAVVAQAPVVTEMQFPSALPPQETAQMPVATTSSVGTEVALNPPMKQPNEPHELNFELPGTPTTDVAPTVETPAVDIPAASLPVNATPTTQLPVPHPVETAMPVKELTPVTVQPVVDSNLPAAKDIALKSDLKDVLDRLASLEAKVDDLADSFSAKVDAPVVPVLPDQTAPSDVPVGSGLNTNALPVASIDNIDPPLKPIVIKGLTLVGVSGDTAWVNTGKDVIAVKRSDALPNGGKVEDIRQYYGDWVLIATDGLVLR